MCDFIVNKAIDEMLNKMMIVVCGSHSDKSAKKLQKHIYSIKARAGRDKSGAGECSAEGGKIRF